MKIKYSELIDQTLYFPTEEFNVSENNLLFHDIPLMDVVEKFGTPLKISYLPRISQNIQKAKSWFKEAFEKTEYKKNYTYCYCTKSSHFKFVLEEALKNFDGTVVVISHDRYFISQIATKIVEIQDGQLVLYHGNYQYYLELKAEQKERALRAREEAERLAQLEAKRAKEKAKEKARKEAKQEAKKAGA